ncbi:hypothetical protein V2O64_22820 [Verrucomicrobiaceae bacterium 227]
MKMGIVLRGLLVLGVVWGIVWGITSWSGDRKATPAKVEAMIEDSDFEDWSTADSSSFSESQREQRRVKMAEISQVLNLLDLRQRKQLDERGRVFDFFFKLNGDEKMQFVEMTFTKSAGRLMDSFDEMDAKEREKMVDRSVQDMVGGKGASALARLKEEDPEVLSLVIEKGFTAYYQDASAETKMALLPFMNAVGEVVQGFAQPGRGGL